VGKKDCELNEDQMGIERHLGVFKGGQGGIAIQRGDEICKQPPGFSFSGGPSEECSGKGDEPPRFG